MKLIFRLEAAGGRVRVDGVAPCGRVFEGVAFVLDPESEKPGLDLPEPLGLGAVTKILALVHDYPAKWAALAAGKLEWVTVGDGTRKGRPIRAMVPPYVVQTMKVTAEPAEWEGGAE